MRVVLQVEFAPWPLLLTVVSGRLTDADVDVLREANSAALRRGGRFISLVDITAIEAVPTPLQRQTYAAWRKEHFEALKRHVVAVGFVVGDRPLLRGGLTALSWLAQHPSPEAFFGDRGAALTWLRQRLADDDPGQAGGLRKSIRPGARWLK